METVNEPIEIENNHDHVENGKLNRLFYDKLPILELQIFEQVEDLPEGPSNFDKMATEVLSLIDDGYVSKEDLKSAFSQDYRQPSFGGEKFI